MRTSFEKMGGTYTLGEDGLYYPDLVLPKEEKAHYGKYGMLRKTYLKEHQKGLYTALLLEGKLTAHLSEIDDVANARIEVLIRKMQESHRINEKLKAQNQMAWVGAMNNIYNAAEEIILRELIYI